MEDRIGSRRLGVIVSTAALLALLPAAPSSAVTTCTLAAGALDVTIGGTDPAGYAQLDLGEAGGAISVETADGSVDCAGGSPTTANTERISVVDGSAGRTRVRITDVPILRASDTDGSDEIKVDLTLGIGPNEVVIQAAAPARIVMGTAGVNVNAEADADIDVTSSASPIDELVLRGTNGDDQIRGSGGSGTGAATLQPLRIDGLGGDDTIHGGASPDAIFPGDGSDTIDCAGGSSDWLDYSSSSRVRIDVGAGVAEGRSGPKEDTFVACERLRGSDGSDIIIGSDGSDYLVGGDGSDLLIATPGNDLLAGGHDPSNDDTSTDTLDLSRATGGAALGLGNGNHGGPSSAPGLGSDTVHGIENVVGTRFADILTGNDESNVLIGGRGSDDIDGFEGNDTASYATSSSGIRANLASGRVRQGRWTDELVSIENVVGSRRGDVIRGDGRANVLRGGRGRDRLYGKGGRDRLEGGSGRDMLNGGSGYDRCFGGRSRDRFRACNRRRQ